MASIIIVFLYILDICVLQQGAVLFFLETSTVFWLTSFWLIYACFRCVVCCGHCNYAVISIRYVGFEIKITKDNQTCELNRQITLRWATYWKLKHIFQGNTAIHLKRIATIP